MGAETQNGAPLAWGPLQLAHGWRGTPAPAGSRVTILARPRSSNLRRRGERIVGTRVARDSELRHVGVSSGETSVACHAIASVDAVRRGCRTAHFKAWRGPQPARLAAVRVDVA